MIKPEVEKKLLAICDYKTEYHKEEIKTLVALACCTDDVEDSIDYVLAGLEKRMPIPKLVQELKRKVPEERRVSV